ncbi:FCH domain-containing protein [Plasmodiophora brassicae]
MGDGAGSGETGAAPPSFVGDLWTDFDVVVRCCENGYKSINELIAFLRERIRCERVHCRNLTKLSRRAVGQGEFGTLASAIDRLRVDVVQGANERLSYSSSLETDVLPELAEMKDLYEKVNGKLIQEGRRVTKALMDARDRMHRKADSDHAESASSSTTVAFFRAKFKPAKSDDDGGAGVARHLKQAESIYTDVMISVLEGIQSNEEARIRCFRAALRKIVVFETSLVANRSYDMKDMAALMEGVDHTEVLQRFIASVKSQHHQRPASPSLTALARDVVQVLPCALATGQIDPAWSSAVHDAHQQWKARMPAAPRDPTPDEAEQIRVIAGVVQSCRSVQVDVVLSPDVFATAATAFRLVVAALLDSNQFPLVADLLDIAARVRAQDDARTPMTTAIVESDECGRRLDLFRVWQATVDVATRPSSGGDDVASSAAVSDQGT